MGYSAAEPNLLTYAAGANAGLSCRGWHILFWVGAIHLVAVLLLAALSVPSFLRMWEFLRAGTFRHWFPLAMLINNAEVPVMALANGLAVAGYWSGLRGQSPARWFRIYVPTQLALMVLFFGITVAMLIHGPYQVTPSSMVGATPIAFAVMPVAFVVMNLPLVLLLIPKIRRSCFAG